MHLSMYTPMGTPVPTKDVRHWHTVIVYGSGVYRSYSYPYSLTWFCFMSVCSSLCYREMDMRGTSWKTDGFSSWTSIIATSILEMAMPRVSQITTSCPLVPSTFWKHTWHFLQNTIFLNEINIKNIYFNQGDPVIFCALIKLMLWLLAAHTSAMHVGGICYWRQMLVHWWLIRCSYYLWDLWFHCLVQLSMAANLFIYLYF